MFQSHDTIAAISSAVGAAARMIVRLSGSDSQDIASKLTSDLSQSVRHCRLRFRDFDLPSWIYVFRAPHSYTGQDTIEFHIPGNPLLARMLLDELVRLGARRADPGEFTARAYFNGRLDLSQAEGVAATIAANSDAELRAARQLLAGELARRVKPALDSLADALALIEVGIDFSEEDVEFISPGQIHARLDAIDRTLDDLLRDSARLERLHHTPQFVLVGRPNAGKSTLLNALAGEHRAVVSPHAGTTRDALSADVTLSRGVTRMIDIAGIDDPIDRNDSIAAQMQSRARQTIESADRVLLVQDCLDDSTEPLLPRAPDLVVFTKLDLEKGTRGQTATNVTAVRVSALTGENMDELRQRLDKLAFGASTASTLALNARHIHAIHDAQAALARAHQRVADGAELIAAELREALDALGAILGQITPDDVLGRIFSSFCIGK
jgi:tRNA modification GTPase